MPIVSAVSAMREKAGGVAVDALKTAPTIFFRCSSLNARKKALSLLIYKGLTLYFRLQNTSVNKGKSK